MQHEVAAPAAGIVTDLPVTVGAQVELGAVLVIVGNSSGREAGDELRRD
jgi:biotin carboxyl carrier protein